ncbi:hypothetical protein ACIQW9_07185 [Herminiimonas sp. NPDC097707]|uniref:hypothetical protein n=1 Tax=Herminiimonas sp. NPDC097707 TaxID=3364007 RepID=UPI00383AE4DF
MLSETLKPIGFDTWDKEEWEQYRTRLNLPEDEALLQFYRQVVYDHFEHFNTLYPDFVLEEYVFTIEQYTAHQANDVIRFFQGEVMDWWGDQYDHFSAKNQDYIIFQAMSHTKTFPFPPILIDARRLKNKGKNECGKPLHLIEGTHRVSYLRHMLANGIVSASSKHSFVALRPIAS